MHSAQLLKQAPPLSLAPLLELFNDVEQQAQLPTQLQMHMVVMLPKNTTLERPITVLYRVWCRLRKPLLDQWQNHAASSPMNQQSQAWRQRPAGGLRGTRSQWQAWSHGSYGHVHIL